MRGAIMQPYFFPYIGYYQLAYEVEKFIFLDDVNFIKKGFINSNSILLQGKRHDFSIPVLKVSQNRHISDHFYAGEFGSFLKTLESGYKKAPFFLDVWPMVEAVITDADNNVAAKNALSVTSVFSYLGLERNFEFSSRTRFAEPFKGQDRIIALCDELKIDRYRNSIGGRQLYSHDAFANKGIELKFIQSRCEEYPQPSTGFVKNLSIIDALMNISKSDLKAMLCQYELVD